MTTFTNKALLTKGVKNLLNLSKTTVDNEAEFREEFVQMLVLLKNEYQKIKAQPYTNSNQLELANIQRDIVQEILKELEVVTINTKKTKSRTSKAKEVAVVEVKEETITEEKDNILSDKDEEINSTIEFVFSEEDKVNE